MTIYNTLIDRWIGGAMKILVAASFVIGDLKAFIPMQIGTFIFI